MKNKSLIISILFVFLIAWASNAFSQDPNKRVLVTKTGKMVSVTEFHSEGQSLSDVKIIVKGFKNLRPIVLKGIDPIVHVALADLNNDGYDELIIFTKSAGSGSAGEIIGYTSHKDFTLVPITILRINEKDKTFKGYMGHDSLYISEDNIVKDFPVYKRSDPNCCPTGGRRTVKYILRNDSLVISAEKKKSNVFKPTEKFIVMVNNDSVVFEHEKFLRYRLTEKGKVATGELNTERGYCKDENATVFILNPNKPIKQQEYFVRLSSGKFIKADSDKQSSD